MRLCPFCKEKIREDAIKCKHCGEYFNETDIVRLTQFEFPKVWVGYILGILFLVIEIGEAVFYPQAGQEKYSWWSVLLSLGGIVYWYICLYEVHKTIFKITNSNYPITPARAVGYSFIPFYNLYWIFKWPTEIINMVNVRIGKAKFKTWVPGLLLFFFMFLGRIDGAIWLVGIFSVLGYLIRRIKVGLVVQPEALSYKNQSTPMSVGAKIAISCAVAIPILALLAAIAIPNILRARLNANETSAISTLKDYHRQQQTYKMQNYTYQNIDDLEKNGYSFKLKSLTDYTYAIKAEPINPNVSGQRIFSIDETGVITSADGKVIEYVR
ncbi:MAG: hypothetical protein M0R20_03735 [Candidatus Omnitrophica bacterium]|jgi:competence protein ComGC|nr:hypothetical protein [Candidatus Omnitrophota bacterium]